MPQPRPARLALGFVLAPLVPAFVWAFSPFILGTEQAGIASSINFFVTVCIFAYGAAALIGIPAYLLLRRLLRPRLATLMAAGGLVAIVPWLIIAPPFAKGPARYAAVGDCVTVIDGVRTWCGLFLDLRLLAFVFALGALGGLMFWHAAVWRDGRLNVL